MLMFKVFLQNTNKISEKENDLFIGLEISESVNFNKYCVDLVSRCKYKQ